MEMNKKNDCCENVNQGITCDVKNCQYHEGDCYCTAHKIAVGPSFATPYAPLLSPRRTDFIFSCKTEQICSVLSFMISQDISERPSTYRQQEPRR